MGVPQLPVCHSAMGHCLQMAWSIADRTVSPGLRCLQLAAARGATIPVGCRRMHPDFSHLERLSISADIFLCINFLCHLLPLRHALAALNSASSPVQSFPTEPPASGSIILICCLLPFKCGLAYGVLP